MCQYSFRYKSVVSSISENTGLSETPLTVFKCLTVVITEKKSNTSWQTQDTQTLYNKLYSLPLKSYVPTKHSKETANLVETSKCTPEKHKYKTTAHDCIASFSPYLSTNTGIWCHSIRNDIKRLVFFLTWKFFLWCGNRQNMDNLG